MSNYDHRWSGVSEMGRRYCKDCQERMSLVSKQEPCPVRIAANPKMADLKAQLTAVTRQRDIAVEALRHYADIDQYAVIFGELTIGPSAAQTALKEMGVEEERGDDL